MTALIDAIGAVIIGGLLLLTMVTSLFNINSKAADIGQQVILAEVSEDIARIVGEYLSLAGAGVGGQIISPCGRTGFRFTANDTTYTSLQRTYELVQGNSTDAGYPFEVYIDNQLVLGPFFLADSLRFTYFDASHAIITMNNNGILPDANLPDVRLIRMEMEFYYDAFAPDSLSGPDSKDPKNRIVLWRYLMNMYL